MQIRSLRPLLLRVAVIIVFAMINGLPCVWVPSLAKADHVSSPAFDLAKFTLGAQDSFVSGATSSSVAMVDTVNESAVSQPNLNTLQLPTMYLPYLAEAHILWTGGPHIYGEGTNALTWTMNTMFGSGLDFAGSDPGINPVNQLPYGRNFRVMPIAGGVVDEVGYRGGDYGWYVAVWHWAGGISVYCHLLAGSIRVQVGDVVYPNSADGVIALAGKSGAGGGESEHLHLELRQGNSEETCTPYFGNNCWFGNPMTWHSTELHDVLMDGYHIYAYLTEADWDDGYNYEGSAVKIGHDMKAIDGFPFSDAGTARTGVVTVDSDFPCDNANPSICTEDNSLTSATQFALASGGGDLSGSQLVSQSAGNLQFTKTAGRLISSQTISPGSDTTPPTVFWVSPTDGQSITSRTVSLEANASDDSSGVKEVRFSAKYNGAWNGLAVDTSSPYVFDWDMCSYGVPDGDVELGLETTDNAGNKYVYSQDPANGGNIHVNKSYNCNTPPAQGCAAPGLISPSDGETLGSRTITFSWNPVSGCSFNGYTFRVCTSSDVDTLSNCFIDSGEGSTQRTETITDHDNMDLWWGVKAANASAGSSWAVRRFTINPAAANGQWNASYFNTRTCWDDHNSCNGTTFNETLYVPGGGTLIDKNYGSSAPGGSIGSDNWTGRYEGTFNFATGNYVFYADHDDGLKLNIWNYGEHTKDSSGTNSVICNGNGGYFLSGDMPIRLYLREDGGDAKIKLRWSTDTSVCGSGSGGGVTGGSWSADYFNTRTCWDDHNNCNGTTYHDSPSFPGADTLIDKNWGQSSPGNGISQDNWTGRFVGTFNFQPAKYVFYADHDDGLKLQFGGYGEHTKDSSGSNSMICNGADGYSLSGNQQIKLYLREDGGDARVKLRWNTDTTACLPVPSAPAGVVASDGTYSDHIRVTWNAASYATVYEVWRNSTNNSATAAVIHNYVTATSYDDAYIVPGQTYYYWIKAKNSKGTSGFSVSDFGFAAVLPPAAPTGVSASDGDYTDIVLVTWLAVPGATGYEVWRNTADNSGSATQIASAVNGTSYADTTVSIGQTYYYWTKARNVSGAGSFSASDSGHAYVAAPAAPSGVTASDGTYPDGIRVSWLAAAGALSYEIWRNTSDSSGSATLIAVGVDGTEYDDTGTTSDQVYYYWIKATNSGGSSGFGASDSGYSHAPTPAEVTDLAVTKSSTGAVLTWSHIDPIVMQYEVYRSEYPYFTPGQGDSTKLEPDLPAPAVGEQASFTDATPCSGENTPCFYAVVAVNMYGKPSAASNRVGIFSFTMEPGTDPTAEPDLAAWWQAEGNTLDAANDNDGTLYNGAGYGLGRVGQGFVFDGVNDYLEVPHSASLSPAAFTVEAWVRFDSFYSGKCATNTIVGKGVDNTAGFYGLHVQDTAYSCSSTTGQHGLVMSMRMQDGSGVTVRGVTVLLANTWYHLAATWDGSMVRLYVNGAPDGQTGPLTGKTLGSNTQALTIGRHAHTSYPYWVDGVIDEVKIHNRALSETEIRDAYGHD